MFSGNGLGFGDFLGGGPQGPFMETYRCFPISFDGKEDKEKGDKIVLPASAFEKLARMTITYPMQFELRNENVSSGMDVVDLTNPGNNTRNPVPRTHVGVLEFTAKEGQCFVPYWIMQNLLLTEGSYVTVKNVTLPLAKYVKFQPQSLDFLEISNPKAVLESVLRNFSCLTKNDQICVPYNGRKYYLNVLELESDTPKEACSVVETDIRTDFCAPPGYKEPEKPLPAPAAAPTPVSGTSSCSSGDAGKKTEATSMAELAKAREARLKQLEAQSAQYVPFSGGGMRVDGKKKGDISSSSSNSGTTSAGAKPVASARKGKWKSKTKGTSFHGEGRSLS